MSTRMKIDERMVLMMPIHLHVFFDPPFPGMVYSKRRNKPYGNVLIQNITECIELCSQKSEKNACQRRVTRILGRERRKYETQRNNSDSKPLNTIDRSLQNDTGIQCAPDRHGAEGHLEQAAATVGETRDQREE